ncbi:MAG TPA: histidine phosphatase family protein [Acidimicrobiales bacterium]|nr:histidine phosphatase family protein [Acidimicrobiales bacterium]
MAPAEEGDVLVLRHAETTWNAEDRWTGQSDPPLTDAGRDTARRLAEQLQGFGFGAVASSDMGRARETAAILAELLGLPEPRVVPELRERQMGAWTGMTRTEIEEGWPGWLALWKEGELEELPEAETRDAFDGRVVGALTRLAADCTGRRVLVVGHAGTLRALERHCGTPGARHNLGGVWLRLEDGSLRCTGPGPELNPP